MKFGHCQKHQFLPHSKQDVLEVMLVWKNLRHDCAIPIVPGKKGLNELCCFSEPKAETWFDLKHMISSLADFFYKFIALKDILHVCIFCQYLFVLISDILFPEFLCVIRQISFAADYAASVANLTFLTSLCVTV